MSDIAGQMLSSNGQNSSENDQNKEKFLQRIEPIEGTPFYLIVQPTQWFITFSNYRVSEAYEIHENHPEDDDAMPYYMNLAKKELEQSKWNIIMRMVGITHEKLAEEAARYMASKNGE